MNAILGVLTYFSVGFVFVVLMLRFNERARDSFFAIDDDVELGMIFFVTIIIWPVLVSTLLIGNLIILSLNLLGKLFNN